MGKKNIFVILFLTFLISLTLVNAQPPFETNVNPSEGLQIFFPPLESVPQNSEFTLHIHLSNISNGFPLFNNQADCRLHLYDNTGNHTLESGILEKDSNGFDHEIFISSGNFSRLGEHAFYIFCNNTALGGEARGTFLVTRTGTILGTAESLVYSILAFGVFLLFIISGYFLVITPYSNKTNDSGAVIQVSKLKYVKLGLILFTWVLLTWFLNILIGLATNFVSLTMYLGFFGFIFETMNRLALPLGIFILVMAGFEIVRDTNALKEISKFGSAN